MLGELVAGRFRLESVIGSGGMGTVYRASDTREGEPAAVKVVRGGSDAEARRFAREAEILERLSHPGIVRYRAHGTCEDGTPFLAMDWLEGEDLETRLKRRGASPEESVRLGVRLAEALAAAHDAGVVHRDIKPGNVFLVDGDLGRAKLLDFGIARLSTVHGATRLTGTGLMVGTPAYMAPEQARGDRVDARSDVFALGAVLFACITGRPPFAGEDMMAVLAKVLLEPTPRVRDVRGDVDPAVDELLARMMAKDPEGRPPDMRAVARALEALEPLGGAAPAEPAPSPAVIGTAEQRMVTVVAAGAGDEGTATATAPTLDQSSATQLRRRLRGVGQRHGARVEVLADGSVVAVVDEGTPGEQAVRASRFALAVASLVEGARVVVATGRTIVSGPLPVGEAIERAVRQLRQAPDGTVLVDDETASLLDTRFDVEGSTPLRRLRGERDVEAGARTLLGRATPFVGRRSELTLLDTTWRDCVTEPAARAVLVTGAAGMGKSRLGRELVSRVLTDEQPPTVLVARADPMRAGSPFGALAPAIRRASGIREGAAVEDARGRLSRWVGRHVPGGDAARVCAFVGELAGVPFDEGHAAELRAARTSPALMAEQIERAFVEWLAAEVAVAPWLLVLEDLHWGDAATIRLIDAVLDALEEAPLMVLALARPEIHDAMPRLWEGRDVTTLALGKLSKKAARRLVVEVLGDTLDAARVDQLVERADGNAFFLEELIRSAAEHRGESLPDTVLGTIEARLDDLEPDARLVLRAASVFGQTFAAGGVRALLGEAVDVAGWLATLARRELVAPRRGGTSTGERELAFRHALVRDACYAMLTDADREKGHRRAAEWLEARGEPDPVVLAEHWERGGEAGRAAGWYLRAARAALDGNDLAGAIDHAERGVACGAEGHVLGALRRHQAEALFWRGDAAPARDRAEEALRLLDPRSTEWISAVAIRAESAAMLVDWEGVEPWIDALVAARPASDAKLAPWVDALTRVAICTYYVQRTERTDALTGLACAEAERIDDVVVAARVCHLRAMEAGARNDVAAAAALYDESATAFASIGALRMAVSHRCNGASKLLALGQPERTLALVEDALELAQRARIPYMIDYARLVRAAALARTGARGEAVALFEQCAARFHERADPRLEGAARYLLADACLGLGEVDRAREQASAAVDLLASLPGLRATALGFLARARLEAGAVDDALTAAETAMAEVEAGTVTERELYVRLVSAEALDAAGRRPEAERAIGDAFDVLRARADALTDAESRRCFLENVPENHRITELATAWGVTDRGA